MPTSKTKQTGQALVSIFVVIGLVILATSVVGYIQSRDAVDRAPNTTNENMIALNGAMMGVGAVLILIGLMLIGWIRVTPESDAPPTSQAASPQLMSPETQAASPQLMSTETQAASPSGISFVSAATPTVADVLGKEYSEISSSQWETMFPTEGPEFEEAKAGAGKSEEARAATPAVLQSYSPEELTTPAMQTMIAALLEKESPAPAVPKEFQSPVPAGASTTRVPKEFQSGASITIGPGRTPNTFRLRRGQTTAPKSDLPRTKSSLVSGTPGPSGLPGSTIASASPILFRRPSGKVQTESESVPLLSETPQKVKTKAEQMRAQAWEDLPGTPISREINLDNPRTLSPLTPSSSISTGFPMSSPSTISAI